jgi:hypothetical protein
MFTQLPASSVPPLLAYPHVPISVSVHRPPGLRVLVRYEMAILKANVCASRDLYGLLAIVRSDLSKGDVIAAS